MTAKALLHILIVDDEDSFRLSLEMALKLSNSFVVQSCDSGDTAVEIMKQEHFDVVILDHRMPGMSGLEVLQWMNEQKLAIPVIMITAAGSETVAVEALKHGVYDYIRKDQIDVDRLSMAIKSVHERYLYRKGIIEREAEDRLLKEKQKELDALQMFHSTVNSVGQLIERSLVDLTGNLKRQEEALLKSVNPDAREQCIMVFKELRQGVDVVASGVSSMRNLSSVVIHRLDEIKITLQQSDKSLK